MEISIDTISDFFDILNRLDRSIQGRYKEHFLDVGKCEQEVFVRRTVDKWLMDKKFKYVKTEGTGSFIYDIETNVYKEPREITYKQVYYVRVNRVEYVLGPGQEIRLKCSCANTPGKSMYIKLSENKALTINAVEIDEDTYDQVEELFKVGKKLK